MYPHNELITCLATCILTITHLHINMKKQSLKCEFHFIQYTIYAALCQGKLRATSDSTSPSARLIF